MISILVYDQNKNEREILIHQTKESVAYCSDEMLNIKVAANEKQGQEYIRQNDVLDVAYMEVTNPGGINLTKHFREVYALSQIVLIADSSISPMEYMTPDIRAVSLLLRPFSIEQCKCVIRRFFQTFYNRQSEQQSMVIENQQGKIIVPFSKIYYLEVRGKKVYIRLKEKEYSQYGTLDAIQRELPDEFMRCHRSFVVNTGYINRVKLSENMIYLENEMTVPLSRSYKQDIKQYVRSLDRGKELFDHGK